MTTKFPLCAILMELAACLAAKGSSLDLHWLPREQNIEADELSNNITHRFKPENEIKIDPSNLKFVLLDELLDEGERLYDYVDNAKKKRPTNGPRLPRKARRKPETY